MTIQELDEALAAYDGERCVAVVDVLAAGYEVLFVVIS